MAGSGKRLGIGIRKDLQVVDVPVHGSAVVANYLEAVRPARLDAPRTEIVVRRIDSALRAIRRMLVDAREHMELVFPSSEDREVASGGVVAHRLCGAPTITPKLGLDVALLARTRRVELDACVHRQPSPEPRRVIPCVSGTQAPVLDVPRWRR